MKINFEVPYREYHKDNTIISKLSSIVGPGNKSQWLEFMDLIADHLPFLLERGRPKNADIEKSPIGKAGFKTWKEFVELKLRWNIYTWNSWRNAYKKTKEFPYLRDMEVTASAIISMACFCKPKFPSSQDEWLTQDKKRQEENKKNIEQPSISIHRQNEQMKIKDQEITGLKHRLAEIEDQFNHQKSEIERLRQTTSDRTCKQLYQDNLILYGKIKELRDHKNYWYAINAANQYRLKAIEDFLKRLQRPELEGQFTDTFLAEVKKYRSMINEIIKRMNREPSENELNMESLSATK